MEIDFQETNGNRGEAVFGNFISYLDGKVSLIILGQTMTAEVSKSGGSLAQAKVQENVRMDIVRFDARQNAATVNRDLIRPAVAMNFGPQDIYPTVQMELAENEDLAALGAFLGQAVPLGLKVSQSYVRKRASIPEPDEDEELLGAPRAADAGQEEAEKRQSAVGDRQSEKSAKKKDATGQKVSAEQLAALGARCPSCGEVHGAARFAADDPTSEITALDDTDALVDEALSDWREIHDPLLAGLLSAVGQATTFEEALANIEKAKIESAPLQETLARAAAKSRGLGDVRD